MKKISMQILMILGIMLGWAGFQNPAIAQVSVSAKISYQTFYDDLSPYGTWIDYPSYGHVWHPSVEGNFRPYLSNGHWDYSDHGWMWMSDYSWGWAPFHYGRWIYDDSYGWLWVPGYEWSPAWVTWGSFDDYYAWAPLMPDVNVGISFGAWRPAPVYWNVCSRRNIYDRNIYNHIVNRTVVVNNINRINIINNFSTTRRHNQFYSKGPEVAEVQKFTGRKIDMANLHDRGNKGAPVRNGNTINAYRPTVNNPQPRTFRRMDNNFTGPVRNGNDRAEENQQRQRQNINRLPSRTAPEGMNRPEPGGMRGGGGQGNGGGHGGRKH